MPIPQVLIIFQSQHLGKQNFCTAIWSREWNLLEPSLLKMMTMVCLKIQMRDVTKEEEYQAKERGKSSKKRRKKLFFFFFFFFCVFSNCHDRSRTAVVGKAFHTSWKKKQEKRAEMEHVRSAERERREREQQRLEEMKEKREAKLRMRAQNEKRAEAVVPLNPKKLKQKLKTMSKKQLRQIRKVQFDPMLASAKAASTAKSDVPDV